MTDEELRSHFADVKNLITTHNGRISRMEESVEHLADTCTIEFTRTQQHFREMQREMDRRDARIEQVNREARDAEKRLDDRIEKLVSAIGELVRKIP